MKAGMDCIELPTGQPETHGVDGVEITEDLVV